MEMKFRTFIYCLVLGAVVLSSCSKQVRPFPSKGDGKMTFSVTEVDGMNSTRAMIEDIATLQTACTPSSLTPFTLQESIGIWADFDYLGSTTKNLLSNVELAYYDKAAGNAEGWNYNYGTDEEYWQLGGVYRFRGYYPQQYLNDNKMIMETSSATTFVVDYNTLTTQEDLMVSYQEVDTKTWPDLSKPISFQMHHALAAMQFRIQFKYSETDKYFDEDALTACWMTNTTNDGLGCVGLFGYGALDEGGNYDAEKMVWKSSFAPFKDETFYKWEYTGGTDGGLKFWNEDIAGVDNAPNQEVHQAVAYSVAPTGSGSLYSGNSGWIFVMPQKSEGDVQFCFTTKKGGADNIYHVTIPLVTGTDANGPNPTGREWIPGYRYTYTISITKTNLDVMISIAPWNKYDSSFDIPI